MAVYAIGDLQGCYDPFREMLDAIKFDPAGDTLWLTGDLVDLESLSHVREPSPLVCLRCGHEHEGPYDAKVPIERTCPKCRSNSVRALKPKKA